MKTLNESFTDQEWKELSQVKDTSGLTWHDFLLRMAWWYLEMPVNWDGGKGYFHQRFRDLLMKGEEVKTE